MDGTYGFVGMEIENGVGYVTCGDSSLAVPLGISPISDTTVGEFVADPNVTNSKTSNPTESGQMNTILVRHGQNNPDGVTGAAVNLSMNAFIKTGGLAEMQTYVGDPTVQALAEQFYNEALATQIGGATNVTAQAELQIDPTNNFNGTLILHATPGTTWDYKMTSGTMVINGQDVTSASSIPAETPIAVHWTPGEDVTGHPIQGTFDLANGGQVWPAAIRVLGYGDGYQRMLAPIAPTQVSFHGEFQDPAARTAVFQPTLTSKTATITPDGKLTDTFVFGTSPDKNGLNNPWATRGDGSAREVGFKVTAYETGADAPDQSATVPAGAKAVGSATVVGKGSGSTGSITISGVQPQSHYTFVAAYDPDTTPAATKLFLPKDYAWQHAFGMKDETTVVPMTVDINTKVLTGTIAPGVKSGDSVTLSTKGPWLNVGGKACTVVAYGEFIDHPAGDVKVTDSLPKGAVVSGTAQLIFTKAGTVDTAQVKILSGDITAQQVIEGSQSWHWQVRAQDQVTPGCVLPMNEKYGLPEQTQKIVLPKVTTKASQPTYGGDASDTIKVDGQMPGKGEIHVVAKPYDVPAGTTDLKTVCTEQNLVKGFNTALIKVTTSPSEHQSPSISNVTTKKVWGEEAYYTPTEGPNKGVAIKYFSACAEDTEISTPGPKPSANLAMTGDSTSLPLALGAAGVLVLGAGLIVATALVRRRKAAALAGDVQHRSTYTDTPDGV
ncbi:hypothetical protein ACIPY5_19945 [Microbacterium sp. NPDC089698]|uniref:hypothetical protein n=1 Tax=Microbacterium sp. NPDC089698 TaxID=3364200 RepID=UPI0038059F34